VDEMKQFMLFAYDHYHPQGGMYDFVGDFDTVPECFEVVEKGYDVHWSADGGTRHCDWERAHIYDLETRKVTWVYLSAAYKAVSQAIEYEPAGWRMT
jgi:hypothetical protein